MTDEREFTDEEIVDTIEFLRTVVRIKTKEFAHYDGEQAHRAAQMLHHLHTYNIMTRYNPDGGAYCPVA